MPQVAGPADAAGAGASADGRSGAAQSHPNTLLIVIFCLLAFLAGGIVVYLLLRHG